MLGYLSMDIICFEKRTVFWECSSRKTVSFKEQIMSKYKYPSIFSPQMETIVFIILQIFYTTHALLKIGGYSRISPSFSWGIFGHVTCLDQSRASKKIWWIIISNISFCSRDIQVFKICSQPSDDIIHSTKFWSNMMKKDISTILYHKCVILCSKILLNVLDRAEKHISSICGGKLGLIRRNHSNIK